MSKNTKKTVLFLYPDEFNVQTKFNRKADNILKNITGFDIEFIKDNKGLIKNYIESFIKETPIRQINSIEESKCTHAIVFDDGEVFVNEIKALKSKKVPLRVIPIKITRVINIKREKQYKSQKTTSSYEYIGRGSYWGNPYSMFENGEDREEVIRKYKYDFDYEKFPNKDKQKVHLLAGKRLGCFCKPCKCHGDILADYLNSFDDGK